MYIISRVKNQFMPQKLVNILLVTLFSSFLLTSCGGGDALKNPPEPEKRVAKNLSEGRGFRLDNALSKGIGGGGGTFEFASSNELWRASLDIIDFMPLTSANYSGGIIITDWYSEKPDEAIKITIRFLSNEVRSDALDIKIFYKKCENVINCKISDYKGNLKTELTKEILKKAAIYKKQNKDKLKPYAGNKLKKD
tara:strand:+ start:37 stop:621 length:585 start_codon:yes stop_codon:yes gene_type:complete